MDTLSSFLRGALPAMPMVVAIVLVLLVLFAVRAYFEKRMSGRGRTPFQQVVMLALSLVGVLIIIIVSPLSDTQQGQLLSLLGILLSAAIAISSTTFIGNIMAGFVIRSVRSFRIGDFIRIGDHFGRVTEQGLFHVEIQTEDRDLTTFPNLYLATHPVKVVRSSGTIISAQVSLGYDVPRSRVETLLVAAASAAGLTESFVNIMRLGDFSVTYRIAGLLADAKAPISARSRLRAMMLDRLHEAGVEIVSPTFMNTRPLDDGRRFIPPTEIERGTPAAQPMPETLAFDKADEAESTEKLAERHAAIETHIKQLGETIKRSESDAEKARLQTELDQLTAMKARLSDMLERKTDDLDSDR